MIGRRHVDDILGDMKTLRRTTSQIGKEYANKGAHANTVIEAKTYHEEGMAALEDLYLQSKLSQCLSEMLQFQKDLRRIPVIELDTPTVVLVGSPNVGKSACLSIIECIYLIKIRILYHCCRYLSFFLKRSHIYLYIHTYIHVYACINDMYIDKYVRCQ